jgi:D-alanyl-lipoteichoic acid acyltransferase DltB (MBOAT superfamily)
MLFNSYTFVIFFAIVLLVTRTIGNWTARRAFLLVVSYLFYAAWNPPFVALLWISTGLDWFVAKWVQASTTRSRRIGFLFLSLVGNLGMLSYFKYGNFFLGNINALAAQLGIAWQAGHMNVILPVGISFYTFQTLSYTIDVYRGTLQPSRSFLNYALYVTFFPQLVAGPIVRAADFLPQCEEPKKATSKQLGWGLSLMVIGLFAKIVLADALSAPIVERVFGHTGAVGFLSAWTGTLAFAMQIFYDFFGYSTIAIGAALCLGFDIMDNFRFPYAARGFSDFWNRWHISLSSWLKDYLYIPLGGNRKGTKRTYVNLMATMLLGGLWHGASWMFVIWGGLHGTYLAVERMLRQSSVNGWSVWDKAYGRVFLSLFTFFLVCVTWVFFRAPNLTQAFVMCSSMLDPRAAFVFLSEVTIRDLAVLSPADSWKGSSVSVPAEPFWFGFANYLLIGGLTCGSLLLHHMLRESSLEGFFGRIHWLIRASVLSGMLYLTLISMTGEDSAFIYFQF